MIIIWFDTKNIQYFIIRTNLIVTVEGVVTIWGLHSCKNKQQIEEKAIWNIKKTVDFSNSTYDNVFEPCLGNIQTY